MEKRSRHTKVIFTLGPATEDINVLREVIKAGADVCRLNMAHASPEWLRSIVPMIRSVAQEVGEEIALMLDIKGPEIRTGDLSEPIKLKSGDRIEFAIQQGLKSLINCPIVTVNYPNIIHDVSVGNMLLVDSGLLKFKIKEITSDRLICETTIGGELTSRRHVNLPGVKVSLPPLTDKDKLHVTEGARLGIDYMALSFVRQASDIEDLRRFIAANDSKAQIIAKIEDQSAIENLEPIIKAADGLMIARGDLGIECPFFELPIIQRRAVERCLQLGKPVIIATHMLESMIQNPVPTRAEVTDVANAIYEKADCVMLSGETAIGKYPVQCVEVINQIAFSIENSLPLDFSRSLELTSTKQKIKRSAVLLAQELGAIGIVVFSKTGATAQILSALRPMHCPLYVFTEELAVQRQLKLAWGLEPFIIKFEKDPEVTIKNALNLLVQKNKVAPEELLVVVTNTLVENAIIDTIQIRNAPVIYS